MLVFAQVVLCIGGLAGASAPIASNANAAAAPASATKTVVRDTSKNMDNNKQTDAHPSAALLEYLDQYAGAADGIDPLELATEDDAAHADTGGKGP